MEEWSGLATFLGSEGVGNPSTVALTDDAVEITSMPTVEVIGTSLVARRHEGTVFRKTSAL